MSYVKRIVYIRKKYQNYMKSVDECCLSSELDCLEPDHVTSRARASLLPTISIEERWREIKETWSRELDEDKPQAETAPGMMGYLQQNHPWIYQVLTLGFGSRYH